MDAKRIQRQFNRDLKLINDNTDYDDIIIPADEVETLNTAG